MQSPNNDINFFVNQHMSQSFDSDVYNNLYHTISGGISICFLIKNQECINMSNFGTKSFTMMVVYAGACKTRNNMIQLLENKVNHVLVYNIREINMLNNLGMRYFIKVKLYPKSIGVNSEQIIALTKSKDLTNFAGLYFLISKKDISITDQTDDQLYQTINNNIMGILKSVSIRLEKNNIRPICKIDFADSIDCLPNIKFLDFKISIYNQLVNTNMNWHIV